MKQIPHFKLVPEPLEDEAKQLPKFRWAADDVGTRHQLGGRPTYIQAPKWPDCPLGHGKMTFYGQFDSINDDICLADCGMIYVFVCLDCYETRSFVQSG